LLHARTAIGDYHAVILPQVVQNRLHLGRLRRSQIQFLLNAREVGRLTVGRIECGLVQPGMRAQAHYHGARSGAAQKDKRQRHYTDQPRIPGAKISGALQPIRAHSWSSWPTWPHGPVRPQMKATPAAPLPRREMVRPETRFRATPGSRRERPTPKATRTRRAYRTPDPAN